MVTKLPSDIWRLSADTIPSGTLGPIIPFTWHHCRMSRAILSPLVAAAYCPSSVYFQVVEKPPGRGKQGSLSCLLFFSTWSIEAMAFRHLFVFLISPPLFSVFLVWEQGPLILKDISFVLVCAFLNPHSVHVLYNKWSRNYSKPVSIPESPTWNAQVYIYLKLSIAHCGGIRPVGFILSPEFLFEYPLFAGISASFLSWPTFYFLGH